MRINSSLNHKKGVIIGAGPAGISSAYELYRSGVSNIVIIEKNDKVGGLARTLKFGQFRTDIGPHRFFSQQKQLYDLIEDLLGEKWMKVNRLTRFYIDGKFFLYPIELKNALLNMGMYKSLRILLDYLYQKSLKIFVKGQPVTFEEYIISIFGRTLAELNMLNYTEKIWGLPCNMISSDWAKQRIKGLSLIEVLKKTLKKSDQGPKSLVDQFYYPETGIGLIYEKMKERIINGSDCKLYTTSYPVEIVHRDNIITEVMVNINGDIAKYKPDFIISSIPITEFVNLLAPRPPGGILKSSNKLKFRSHVSIFVTLNKSSVFDDQWIYFPDREVPFGRITEPKNFSKKMSPTDKTSLFIEFFCWKNDEIWNTSKKELFNLTLYWLKKLGFIKSNEVINYYIHKEEYAYPVYDLNYCEYLNDIVSYFNNFQNLQCIGRPGRFRYNNQDHALLMGILAARNIIEGKQYNIDVVGAEQTYFERGYIL